MARVEKSLQPRLEKTKINWATGEAMGSEDGYVVYAGPWATLAERKEWFRKRALLEEALDRVFPNRRE